MVRMTLRLVKADQVFILGTGYSLIIQIITGIISMFYIPEPVKHLGRILMIQLVLVCLNRPVPQLVKVFRIVQVLQRVFQLACQPVQVLAPQLVIR